MVRTSAKLLATHGLFLKCPLFGTDGVGLGAEVGRDGIGVREWNRRELREKTKAKEGDGS